MFVVLMVLTSIYTILMSLVVVKNVWWISLSWVGVRISLVQYIVSQN